MITKLLNYIRTPVTDNISYVEEDNSTKVINDIGEPVLSFVRCFKDNPKRFEVSFDFPTGYWYEDSYYLTDKKLNIIYSLGNLGTTGCIHMDGVLNEKEQEYIKSVLSGYYQGRSYRYKELKRLRGDRLSNKIRKQLTELYKSDKDAEEQVTRLMVEGY